MDGISKSWWRAIASVPVLGLAIFGFAVLLVLREARLRSRFHSKDFKSSNSSSDEKVDKNNPINVFPPSRRVALVELLPASHLVTNAVAIPLEDLKRNQLPTTKVQPLEQKNLFTSTGLLTQEVKALGRFPNYSVLSGVPHPNPAPSFDITKANFRPFRPFRWTYHQTMAVMKMEPDYWIELEQNYSRRMQQRLELWKEHGERVLFEAPGSELAARELMEMVVQFLTIRYPQYFQLEDDNKILRNRLLETATVIGSMTPLEVLMRNVPEDFTVMLRSEEDGNYYLRAATVCSSVGWNIGLHKNKVLRRIHDNVPHWEKMAFSVDRYFTKQACDAPIQRGSWGIEDWEAFFCPEDVPRSKFDRDPSSCAIEDLQLRCDWQTVRRLPMSGAMIFNFKAVFTPLAELAREPYVPALLHRVITQGDEKLIEYKMEKHVANIASEYCEKWARQQEEDGLVEKDWTVGTLEQSPFFPGWEETGDWGACPMRPGR
ncbi:hypothetical protein BKA67DRAFT_626947 [Truncatella angustata]|uniref:Uncharacterized protein n=1 Tax=Truncatella angustata TaxID=152316 RepID=A0A9P8UHN2_9PEZI|nr:uncharacterized protein BKA67DRAFT_626947 [Truncatella angustata]KAH6652264.1 hypothetical protein BKA67DRAFT_626947 [Truncatella angustata]